MMVKKYDSKLRSLAQNVRDIEIALVCHSIKPVTSKTIIELQDLFKDLCNSLTILSNEIEIRGIWVNDQQSEVE